MNLCRNCKTKNKNKLPSSAGEICINSSIIYCSAFKFTQKDRAGKESQNCTERGFHMEYKYGKNDNNEDFSAGRVLYIIKGMTNFPVRLAQEIYGRCLQHSRKKNNICLYDCCCGGGYLLTVLGFLNQDTIVKIIGSDIKIEMLKIAEKNLTLLSKE